MRLFIGRIIKWFGKVELLNFIPDDTYLSILYYFFMGKRLNLSNPMTLNEKIQWIKLFDRKNKYIELVDKVSAKIFVQKCIGSQYIIPTIGVWRNFQEIDFDSLPNKFVLKCTHDSGSCLVCTDKNTFDKKYAERFFKKRLTRQYFWAAREWAYKEIKPQIIAEEYIEDNSTHDLRDYKFYCFGDVVDCVLVCLDRCIGKPKFYFFDKKWNLKRYNIRGKNAPEDFQITKPENIDKMFQIARDLSVETGTYFVRVDLYNVNGNIYFSELTLYPDSGMDRHRLPEIDLYFGSLIGPLK